MIFNLHEAQTTESFPSGTLYTFGPLTYPFIPVIRPYLVNLLPCLELIIKRTEESIHETLAYSLPLLFKVILTININK